MTPNHVVFVCSRLDEPGGSERAVIQTANLLSSKGHSVSILILDETDVVFFPISDSIKIYSAPLHFGITSQGNVLTRKLTFRNHVRKLKSLLIQMGAGIIVATEYHLAITAYLAGKKIGCKIFSWEHHHFNELNQSRFWNYLLHRSYPKLSGVICLNKDESKLIEAIGAKTVVIPNFIKKHYATDGERTLLTVARLSPVKGIDMLLQVAKRVLNDHPSWTWKIIGDGALKRDVERFISQENLRGRLLLQEPVSDDLAGEYGNSSIYVMTSRNECFPMVLLEAMSYGVPCIAFDCETGPRFIIKNDEDGLLVENQDLQAMIRSVNSLIEDVEKRKQFGKAAFENVQRFSPDKVYELWKVLITK